MENLKMQKKSKTEKQRLLDGQYGNLDKGLIQV